VALASRAVRSLLSLFQRYHLSHSRSPALPAFYGSVALLAYCVASIRSTTAPSGGRPGRATAVGRLFNGWSSFAVAIAIVFLRIVAMPALPAAPDRLVALLVRLGIDDHCAAPCCSTCTPDSALRRHSATSELPDDRQVLCGELCTCQIIIGEIERLAALAASPSLRQCDLPSFPAPGRSLRGVAQHRGNTLVAHRSQRCSNSSIPLCLRNPLPKSVCSETYSETFAR